MSTRNHLAPQCPTNFIGLINEHKMIDPDCAEFFWEVSEDSTVGENSLIFRMNGGVREPPDPYCAGMIVHVLIAEMDDEKLPPVTEAILIQSSNNSSPMRPRVTEAITIHSSNDSSPIANRITKYQSSNDSSPISNRITQPQSSVEYSPISNRTTQIEDLTSPLKRTKLTPFVDLAFPGDWSPNDGK